MSIKDKPPDSNIIFEWTTESCFQDHKEIIPELIYQISNSVISIDLEMYIFSLDELGNKIIDHLIKASERGVKVRLLVDGIGSPSFNFEIIDKLFRNHKIEVKVYKPISSWLIKTLVSLLFLHWDEIKLYFISMNHRNHRKTVVFDQRLIMLGSANISQAHCHWRETMVEVTGGDILFILHKFNEVWNKSSNFKAYPVKITDSFKNTIDKTCKNTISRIDLVNEAKISIKIVNPYFFPPYLLIAPLIRASRRGVKVEFMISKKCDVFLLIGFLSITIKY